MQGKIIQIAQEASRWHEFCYGHRVVNHESKCKNLHGHNGKVRFFAERVDNRLDSLGRVVDFSVIKELMCEWLEENWDHKMLLWDQDPLLHNQNKHMTIYNTGDNDLGIVRVPFNPTAENLSAYLIQVVAPILFADKDVKLVGIEFYETGKCSVVTRAV